MRPTILVLKVFSICVLRHRWTTSDCKQGFVWSWGLQPCLLNVS